jgi:UDPglucose--hexose-1-phosphate uridylyltransferase
MSYNELRKDYLLDRWVVIATERARRPLDFIKQRAPQPQNSSNCPLCPNNEHMTPPATLVYLPTSNGEIKKVKDEGDFRHKNWLIRSIPNLYPAFTPLKDSNIKTEISENDNFGYAIGYHEVLIESPNHNDHPSNADLAQIVLMINAYKDRLEDLSKKARVEYVQIFRNHGLEAGASQSHAHSQIIATPFTPTNVCQELAASKKYWDTHKQCLICDIIKSEAETPRYVIDNDHFIVIAPYASVHPMEFWIIPKRHTPNFLDITQSETEALAKTLKTSLKALKDLINDPPYNYGFHLALNRESQNYYHWHLEVYPTLAIWAGFEKSTGMYINTVKPETAASELKKALKH